MIERRLQCLDCGHSSELKPTFPNGKLKGAEAAQPAKTNLSFVASEVSVTDQPHNTQAERVKSTKTNLSTVRPNAQPDENLLTDDEQLVGVVIKPLTPPYADKLSEESEGLSETESREITSAAELLLAVAREHDTHIVMLRTHASKYLEVKRPLEFFDLVDHLKAGEARGALCHCSLIFFFRRGP